MMECGGCGRSVYEPRPWTCPNAHYQEPPAPRPWMVQQQAALRKAFLDGIAWMSERTYLSDRGGYHVEEPSETQIRKAADEYRG